MTPSTKLHRRGGTALVVPALFALLVLSAWVLSRETRAAAADFTFVNEGEPSSLDPQEVTGVPEGRVMRFLYEGLVLRDPRTLAPLPGVAERWEEDADGLAWTFHLRASARWSNGDALTSRDFAFAYRRLLDPRTAAPYAGVLDAVRGAKRWRETLDAKGAPTGSFDDVGVIAADERTLRFELERPVAYFLDLVAFYPLVPLPEKHVEALRARFGDRWELAWARASNVVANGPYVLAERRIRDRLSFAKNAEYWDAANVAFERVDALSVEHPGTMLNLYLTGAVGWTGNFPAAIVPELLLRDDFRPVPQVGTAFYRFNATRPPLDDARVRRALALAIDRRAIVERVTRAGERPQWSFVPSCAHGTSPAELPHGASFAEDCDRARAWLAEAGYGPGAKPLPSIEIAFNTQSNNKDVAEVIADGWRRELGVAARLANQEWKTFLDAQKRLDYQVSKSSWVGDHPDAAGFLEIFRATSANNRTGWRNAEYDELLDRAERARGGERAELLHRAETLLLDGAPIAPLYGYVTKNLVDPRLDGFFENPLDEHPPKFWRWRAAAR